MRALLLVLLLAAPAGAAPKAAVPAPAKKAPVDKCLASPLGQPGRYKLDFSKPVMERAGPAPEWMRDYIAKADGAADYESYVPTPQDLALLRESYALLPDGLKRAFEERLVGIYFIKNFMGNGLTSWVSDGKGPTYAMMIVNPAGFTRSLSETFTLRERSLFKDGQPVSIDAGTRYRGVLYTLLHEGTHAYDFVYGITPYVDDCARFSRKEFKLDASWDVWAAYAKPRKGDDFLMRRRLGFYGLGGGAPLRGQDAPQLYAQLKSSPFVSLYGSKAWAEDAAELVVFHHLTQVMAQPYRIEWTVGNAKGAYEPMKNERVRERAAKIYESVIR